MQRAIALFAFSLVLFASSTRAQRIVVSEVMYAPLSPAPEWIELFNFDGADIDAPSLTLQSGTRSVTLPPFHLSAGGYLVVARDSSLLRSLRGSAFPILQVALPTLRNSGDSLVLRTATGTLDSVIFQAAWGGKSGRSLERRAYWLPGNRASSWRECRDTTGATPGFANSVAIAHRDLAITGLSYRFDRRSMIAEVRAENAGSDTIKDATIAVIALGMKAAGSIAGVLAPDSARTVSLTLDSLPSDPFTLTATILGSDDERQTNDTLRTNVPEGLADGAIVINEVLFAPLAPEPEWIELYNPTNRDQHLSGSRLKVNASSVTLPDVTIPSGAYRVVTAHDSLLIAFHSIDPAKVLHADLPGLSNSGASLALLDARGVTIDSMHYTSGLVHNGQSLERIDPYRSATELSAWHGSSDSTGTTLLRPNSSLLKLVDVGVRKLGLDGQSLQVEVYNNGLDTIKGLTISCLVEGTITSDSVSDTILPPYGSIADSIAAEGQLPAGTFEAEVIVQTSGDDNPTNDTARSVGSITPIAPNDLLINEIMSQPVTGDCEWIEFMNAGDRAVSLRGCYLIIGDTSNPKSIKLGPDVIPPASFALLAANSSIYSRWPELLGRTGMDALSIGSLGLSNDSQAVALRSSDSITIDSLRYRADWHNAALQDPHGISLERRSSAKSSSDPGNWTSCTSPRGATPLAANSAEHILPSSADLTVSLDVNPLPADGVSRTQVEIASPLKDGIRRMRLYGRGGLVVRSFRESLWNGYERTALDATDDDGRPLQPGLYTLLVEVADASGRTTTRRAGLVIAPPK